MSRLIPFIDADMYFDGLALIHAPPDQIDRPDGRTIEKLGHGSVILELESWT